MTPATPDRRRKTIERLKNRARKAGQYVVDHSGDLECGLHLTGFLRPRVAINRDTYERLVRRLARIDPDFPRAVMSRTGRG